MNAQYRSRLLSVGISLISALTSVTSHAECKSDRLRISAGGDVIIHEASYQGAVRNPDRFYSLFASMKPMLDVADISYLNLEGPVANGITKERKDIGDQGFYYDCKRAFCGNDFVFNYHPSLIGDLQRLGVDVVSTANNHSLDRGAIGIDRSVQAFKEYNMRFTGTRSSNGGGYQSTTSAKGWKIAWVGCTEELNGFTDKKNQVLSCGDSETLDLIRRFAGDRTYDAVVVTPHWGPEYQQEPSSQQKSRALEFAEAGATMVIGNHPHVVQRMKVLTLDSGRKVPVIFSLGNFLATQESIPKNLSAVFYFELAKNNAGETYVDSMSYVPTFLNASSKNGSYVFNLNAIDRVRELSYFKEDGKKVSHKTASTSVGTALLEDLLSGARQIKSSNLPSRTGTNCR